MRGLQAAGVSVVIVSHDLDEVAEVADRVCVLEAGEVRALGDAGGGLLRTPGGSLRRRCGCRRSLREAYPAVGEPVRFGETLAALKGVLGA